MPNYPTHSRWGRVGGVVTAVSVGAMLFVVFNALVLAAAGALGAAAATFVGAIFPDIDHHKSIPRRKAVRGLRVLVVLGVAALAALTFEPLVDATETAATDFELGVPPELLVGAGTALVALVAAGLVDPAIGLVTRKHRGWTHSVPVTFALTAVLAAAVWFLTAGLGIASRVAAVVVVGTFFVGILVHLGLDGEIA
jgi:hypothetical protein